MARYYKLIDGVGHPYITTTDRQALSMMLACESVVAHTARKSYKIRISQDLGRIVENLEKREGDGRLLSFERRDAEKMIRTIQKEQAAGRVFYEMIVNSTTGEYYKNHFFA